MILLHGTTRRRAEAILAAGPDHRYREPGGVATDDGFSLNLPGGPFHFGHPEEYARLKAAAFPDEGGPVILVLDVPAAVVALAATVEYPLSQGVVQFDRGFGLEVLLAGWAVIAATAQIQSVT